MEVIIVTLFDVIFSGNDTVYDLTVKAVDDAIAANGADKAVSFPHTAYSLPCYYGVTGTKITNLGDMKNALDVVKSLMTRDQKLNDAFMSGVATALCAEFIEALRLCYFPGKRRGYILQSRPLSQDWDRAGGVG